MSNRVFIVMVVSLLSCTSFSFGKKSPSPSPEVEAKIAKLENKAREAEIFNLDSALSEITEDSVSMYFMWPAIDGLICLYEVTSKREYVAHAVKLAKRYQSFGKDIDGDGYLDWYSSWIKRHSHWHVEWRAADGIARTVALILNNPELKSFEADARTLTAFLEKHVWEKWTGGYTNELNTVHDTSSMGRCGLIALSLYQATGKSKYRDYVKRKGRELKNGLHVNSKDAYYWYDIVEEDHGFSDTSHAGDMVNFIVEAYRAGLVFDNTDIRRLVNTVKKNLWNGSLSSPQFQDYVHGGPEKTKWSSGGYSWVGQNQGGWVKLAQFDAELQKIYYNWVESGKNSWGDSKADLQIYGNLARALYLAEGR